MWAFKRKPKLVLKQSKKVVDLGKVTVELTLSSGITYPHIITGYCERITDAWFRAHDSYIQHASDIFENSGKLFKEARCHVVKDTMYFDKLVKAKIVKTEVFEQEVDWFEYVYE